MSSTFYSHSRLSCYEKCPFQYKLKYVDRVQAPLGTTIEAFVGSRVHDALEWLYRLARDGRVATKEELVQKYQALWEAKWEDEIRVVKQELEVEHYRSNGQQWVEQYWDRYQPFDQGISQSFRMTARKSDIPEVCEIHVVLARLSGPASAWKRSYRLFLNNLRSQCLLWRTLDDDSREHYLAMADKEDVELRIAM